MAKQMRKVLVILSALVLVVALAGTLATTSSAANLTGGTSTYILNGEEVTFQYDPVVRKDGLLLPVDVFQRLSISVTGSTGRDITLTKGEKDVAASLTVGSINALVNNRPVQLATAPLRLSGRLFLPSDILKEFGVDVTQDGNFVVIRNYAGALSAPVTYTNPEWVKARQGKYFMSNPKADTSMLLQAEFTYLSQDIINATNLGLSYGTRARLLTMLETNTLIHVRAINITTKAGAMSIGGFYLVDSAGNQYENPTVLDIGNGLLSSKLAPDVIRTGVLVFPKMSNVATSVNIYYDPNNGNLGTFSNLN